MSLNALEFENKNSSPWMSLNALEFENKNSRP
jgi:hypothetical protein